MSVRGPPSSSIRLHAFAAGSPQPPKRRRNGRLRVIVPMLRWPGMKTLIKRAADVVFKALAADSTGHDAWHIRRVRSLADRIARTEPKADPAVVSLGALLHDLGDWKLGGPEDAAARLLRKLGATEDVVRRVDAVCREVSFKGAGVKDAPGSLEARIVQDADRLDAIGAIGVGRAFAYG